MHNVGAFAMRYAAQALCFTLENIEGIAHETGQLALGARQLAMGGLQLARGGRHFGFRYRWERYPKPPTTQAVGIGRI